MTASKNYIPIISSLRGWAATAICLYHFVWSTAYYITDEWVRTIFYYAQYGVPMFFVISGVVLPMSLCKNNYQLKHFPIFITKRLVRLEPPYWISLLLGAAYLVFQHYRHQGIIEFSWTNFLLHLGYLIPLFDDQQWINPVYWSLAVEFQYYIIIGIGWQLISHTQARWRFMAYCLVLGLSFLSQEKALVFRWLPMFLIGIVYVLQQQNRVQIKEYYLVFFLSLSHITYFLGLPHLLTCLFTLSCIHYFPNYNPYYSHWVGERSYSLYLIHLIVGQALVNFLSHIYYLPYQKFLIVLLGYSSSLLAAWLIHYYIERPSQWAAKQLQYPQ